MRITHLQSTFTTPWGGAEAYLFSLAAAQRARGDEVEIVTAFTDAESIARASACGVAVRVRRSWRPYPPDRHGPSALSRALFHALDAAHALVLPGRYRHVQDGRDVVHVHRFQGVGASVLRPRRAAVVHTAHDYGLVDSTSTTLRDGAMPARLELVQRWRARVVAMSARRASVLVFPSERTRRRHEELGYAADDARVRVVPHGWPAPTLPLGDRSSDGRTRFVFLGRLQKSKGISLLLAAWASASLDAELVIAGDGPERAVVEAATSDTVRYVGWVDAEAKAALIASATALVFPSLWPETFGLVIAESLLMGRPVVATPAAAGDLILDGVNGVVAADATPTAFAEALRRTATDTTLLRRVTDGAEASAAALDFDRHVDRLDDVYRDARALFAAGAALHAAGA